MKFNSKQLKLMANSARRLSIMQIQAANSGHPGAALGAADIITTIYANHLRFDPKNPDWPGRDRFVLSMGHASALLYSVLHLAGYKISTKDLALFRKYGSITPGHPELRTPGVECSTGPLGQGFAMAVGFAIAQRAQGLKSRVYVMCSDGDLMEGIAQEAIALAGLQQLGNLIVCWDDNGISIDGRAQVDGDQLARFRASGWNAVRVDGNDPAAIDAAITAAKKSDKPTLIACKTIIGLGAKAQGQAVVHGSSLDAVEATQLLEKLAAVSDDKLWEKLEKKKEEGKRNNKNYKLISEKFKDGFLSTREISGKIVSQIMKKYGDRVIGATADLAGSTNVLTPFNKPITSKNPRGNFIEFGVREFSMAAAMNGINLAGFKTFCSTFLVFSDYMKPAIRLAALMCVPQTFVFTHDGIGVGEDGPTHQPIEQIANLRAIPNLNVFRPASAAEVRFAWEYALNSNDAPTAIVLSRQKFQLLPDVSDDQISRGGYVAFKAQGKAKATIIATGSEVYLAIAAAKLVGNVNVVSMPCAELFRAQDKKYKDKILQGRVISVEAGSAQGWYEFADVAIGIDRFGVSAPAPLVYSAVDLTIRKIKNAIK